MSGEPTKLHGNSKYNTNLTSLICTRLSQGESMNQILQSEGMPSWNTILQWQQDFPEFASDVARARGWLAQHHLDQVVPIADNCDNGEDAQIARVKIWARLEYAKKVAPRQFGDRVDGTIEHTGTITHKAVSAPDRSIIDRYIEQRKQIEGVSNGLGSNESTAVDGAKDAGA